MNEEKARKLKPQQVFKNYKTLCEYLEEETKTGEARIKQMQNWEQYFTFEKQGHKIIITEIKSIRLLSEEVIPDMTEQELIERYGTKEQKEKYRESLEDNNINKKNSIKRAVIKEANRYADINYNKQTRMYEVEKVYKYPIPKKMVYMKKGLYQYMIPLLLLKLKNDHDENHKILISADGLAKKIYMHNNNYNDIKYNTKVLCTDSIKRKNLTLGEYGIGFNLDNSYDYFNKVDDAISYYTEHALDMLKSNGIIYSQKIQMAVYIEVSPFDIEDEDEFLYDEKILLKKNYKIHIRRATEDEISNNLKIQQELDLYMREELKISNWDIQKRYYSNFSNEWLELYKQRLRVYCQNKSYSETIIGFCEYYEVYAGLLEKCDECLRYFELQEEKKLIQQFNQNFYDLILGNAQNRLLSHEDKYNDEYIDDFANLAGITIFQGTPTIRRIIEQNPEEITVKVKNIKC